MESNIYSKTKKRQDDPRYESAKNVQVFTYETLATKGDVKNKTRYKKLPGTDAFVRKSTLEFREKVGSKYISTIDKYVGKSYPDQSILPENLTDSPQSRIQDHSFSYDKSANHLPSAPPHERNISIKSQRLEHQQREDAIPKSFDKEILTSKVNYDSPRMYTNFHDSSRRESFVRPIYDISKNSSLICKAVNYKGEPVIVNDQIIKDKLILSCRPRSHYGLEGKPLYVDRGETYPPIHSSPGDFNIQPSAYADGQSQQKKDIDYREKGKSKLQRSNAIDMGSLGLGSLGLPTGSVKKSFQQRRPEQCNKYRRKFKNSLWVLFLVNMLLLLTGAAILFLTLAHFLFKPYVNTVIKQAGYVTWLWATLGLALIIIFVALYGIATSLNRTKRMLSTFIILALILAIVILIFLIIFWLRRETLRHTEKSGMIDTFHKYRCHRWAHVAWDDVHENFRCCGVESRGDWKYIPPSCCNASNKEEKISCIGHFISEDQAFERGCHKHLDEYFSWLFYINTCLLVLAFLFLILGILVAHRLLRMYKEVHQCRDVYYISN